jgi:hypothetical protein
MPERSTWTRRLARLWFLARTLPLRARFMTGKASFVEADVHMTTNSVADVSEGSGRPGQPRLLAHYQLETRPPRAGATGWRLYDERVGGAPPHRTVLLACAYCGHRYAIQVLTSIDPLASELTGGKSPGSPASYSSDWFRFTDERYDGPTELYCFHCEQRGEAAASFVGPA